MKWPTIVIAAILLIVMGYIGYIVFALFTNIQDINNCSIASDCMLVSSDDVCGTLVGINKNYEFRWNKKVSYTGWLYELSSTKLITKCAKQPENVVNGCENYKCAVLSGH
ncbi:hypothetical protein HY837_05735 [archaeon]|nr:hypothetical protein [archaeon]